MISIGRAEKIEIPRIQHTAYCILSRACRNRAYYLNRAETRRVQQGHDLYRQSSNDTSNHELIIHH
jgi:hypothetical protein